ncbi:MULTISPECIES: D-alanyl-D-alanine dipeptidase [Symbiopectobacterium]|uniref:D-alanyl-D-alanine dipeptidase n=1 Tax=Symbiopectobacterium TaxID=801 RepID=UPI001A188ADA|nr:MULTISPECIES: D-alanyl-D-alanine dipeptidase [Symbiopectobacterium]MBG6247825.1 D-alanyl-D-alanine dipeptidase [Candidatus Symbiopectobacterium sp. PLON1]MBT9429373.1 D-alanyl-D-alanine dipeptidase [Candidatus Symbiopectobacterium endolongispinus]
MTDVIDLVDLAQTLTQLIIDMKYASADNLTDHPIYAEALCLLHPDAARGLARSVAVAEQSDYRLQLYDAYRPHAAQIRLWDACPDPRFVASLAIGSHHSRGVAVDVTLLDMGTGFDEMNEKSYAWCAALPVAVQRNRLQLYAMMAASGFVGIETEWWHFELPNADRYPLLPDRFGCTLPNRRTAV